MASLFKAGDRLGRYRIVELIGHGGMASVYRGFDEDLERAVAIKVLHPHLEHRREAKERFRREAKAIAKISHPNIVEIYDYAGEEAQQSYIVTQLVSGGNLVDLKTRVGEFPPEIAASIGIQVAQGLEVAHSYGIVHRDIKPENLLIDRDGVVKIADFGIAHLADAQDMTTTGQILGSPFYMSPEQVTGGRLDERSDIFSYGSLLYWLATGKGAFEGSNPHAILRSIVEKEVEEADRIVPSIGKKMSRIIHQCLKKNPKERFQSFGPVIKELEEYLEISAVEDWCKEIKEFIAEPEKYRRERKKKSIEALSARARELEREAKVQEAMDLYNRVLALDPDNEEVLARLKMARSAQSRRRVVRWLASVVLLFSLLGGGFFLGERLFSQRPGKGGDHARERLGSLAPPWKAVSSYNESKQNKEERIVGASVMESKEGSHSLKRLGKGGKKNIPGEKGLSKPRKVRFVPFPKSVNIYVDSKLLGSYFSHQEVELMPGPHKVRFEPLDKDCCEPLELIVQVKPLKEGEKEKVQTIAGRLTLRPASLLVLSDKPADVVVGGEKIGRTGRFLDVRLGEQPTKTVDITVSADGCESWSVRETLRAGKKTTLSVDLKCQ